MYNGLMNFKQVLVALIILVVLGLGFGYWASQAPAGSGVVAEQEQHVLAGHATSTGALEYTEHEQYYDISLLYPAKTALADAAADQKARLTIETALKQERDDFVSNVQGLDASVMPSLGDGHKLMLAATYKTYSSPTSVSFAYVIYEDTGGAHPNTYFKTFVFNLQGSAMGIAEVLSQSKNGLQLLSQKVSADVTAQMKQRLGQADVSGAIFAEGLAPTENNYSNFVIDGDDLLVLIPPYQVAAYVMGSFEVRVPLHDLQ